MKLTLRLAVYLWQVERSLSLSRCWIPGGNLEKRVQSCLNCDIPSSQSCQHHVTLVSIPRSTFRENVPSPPCCSVQLHILLITSEFNFTARNFLYQLISHSFVSARWQRLLAFHFTHQHALQKASGHTFKMRLVLFNLFQSLVLEIKFDIMVILSVCFFFFFNRSRKFKLKLIYSRSDPKDKKVQTHYNVVTHNYWNAWCTCACFKGRSEPIIIF